jgi:ATP-dependent Clp protease ATP-binding subunit ClpC
VLVLAQEEARLLNHSFIGTEHILLGLIHEGEGVAAKALESLGISLEAVRDKVEETIVPAGTAPTGSPPFTPRAKKVLELSLREALQLGHNYIGTEHMLLGLVREGEGVAAQVLVSLGADLSRVRQQVIELFSGYQGKVPSDRTDPSDVQPSEQRRRGDAPRCLSCGTGLTDRVRHRTLESRPAPASRELSGDAEDETIPHASTEGVTDVGETLQVVLFYCGNCGGTLNTFHRP